MIKAFQFCNCSCLQFVATSFCCRLVISEQKTLKYESKMISEQELHAYWSSIELLVKFLMKAYLFI